MADGAGDQDSPTQPMRREKSNPEPRIFQSTISFSTTLLPPPWPPLIVLDVEYPVGETSRAQPRAPPSKASNKDSRKNRYEDLPTGIAENAQNANILGAAD